MRKRKFFLYLPLVSLVVATVILYSPDLFAIYVPLLSNLNFLEKTSLFAGFAFATFAAVESYTTYDHANFEAKRYRIEDARNELEKAYGPLYSILKRAAANSGETKGFWLDYESRTKVDDLLATYPFMFSPQINELYQERIQKIDSMIESSSNSSEVAIDLKPYADLGKLIKEEYAQKVKNYRELLEK